MINTININKEHIPPIPLRLPKSQEEIEGSTTKFGSMMIDLEITFGLRYLEQMKSSNPNNLIILNDLQKTLLVNDLTKLRVLTVKLIRTRPTK